MGRQGYVTPAALGVPDTSKWGTKSEVAHKWAQWLCNICRLGGPRHVRAGNKIRSGPQVGPVAMQYLPPRGSPTCQSGEQNQKWPTSGPSGYIKPCGLGGPQHFRAGDKIRSGPQVGADANPCRLGVADALEWGTKSEVGAQRLHNPWPPGVPDASKRGTKPEVAQKWAGRAA